MSDDGDPPYHLPYSSKNTILFFQFYRIDKKFNCKYNKNYG